MDYYGRANQAQMQNQKAKYMEEIELEITNETIEREEIEKNEPFISSIKSRIEGKDWVNTPIIMSDDDLNEQQNAEDSTALLITTAEGYQLIVNVDNAKQVATIEEGSFQQPEEPSEDSKIQIIYNANGGTGSIPSTQTGDSNETINISFDNLPTRESYSFAGWSQDNNATTAQYTSSGENTITIGNQNITLYAVWDFDQSYAANHPELHIPTGYSHTIGTVSEGYVIADNDGNEFVWIPIESSNSYIKTMGTRNNYLSSMSATSTEKPALTVLAGDKLGTFPTSNVISSNTELADRPEANTINAAGGFWCGRYEAGIPNAVRTSYIANTQSYSEDQYNASNTFWSDKTIYSKPNHEPARNITQVKALELANNWGHANAGEGTVAWQSGLMTGAEWDAVCRFIGQSICDSDCSGWGNYGRTASKSYTDLYHSSDKASDWLHATSSFSKSGDNTARWAFPTGQFVTSSNVSTEKKHIFDIAGNVWEWTTEAPTFDTSHAVVRGGSSNNNGSDYLASTRHANNSATTSIRNVAGFRIVLYVK